MLLHSIVLSLTASAAVAAGETVSTSAKATNTSSVTSKDETENASATASATVQISMPDRPSNACSQPIVVGPCRAAMPRWAFNREEGRCTRFTYGGCRGNDNNFGSKRLCEAECGKPDPEPEPICDLPPAANGLCLAAFPRWTYNSTAGQCEPFTYGGCGGNANRFETEAECIAECAPPPVDVCELDIVPGLCKALFPSWGFDGEECVMFNYGGCGGNGNRFETKEKCEAACGEAPPPVDICELDIVVGPCEAAIPSWAFDGEECVMFNYGGCDGNGNRFETKEECEAACGEAPPPVDICELDIVTGPCRASILSWGFDGEQCVMFTYGGCQGNSNRFKTKKECEAACPPVGTCQLPLEMGRCRAAIPRWGFNGQNCVEFTYGGCGGNGNRFETEEECREACREDICALPTFPPDLLLRCLAIIPAWTFQDGECTPFTYGGCGATANLFFTEEECLELCEPPVMLIRMAAVEDAGEAPAPAPMPMERGARRPRKV